MTSRNRQYWEEYSNLQHTKHRIIREYLNGWFPKLGLWAGKILYVDTHAGKGKHLTGEEGSPLVALRTFLAHNARDKILHKSDLNLIFIEYDQENAAELERELQTFTDLPPQIHWKVYNRDAFDFLKELEIGLAPSFMFVDPFGFKISCEVLRRVMEHPRSELLITLMWRELDMLIRSEAKTEKQIRTLNEVFGCEEWKEIADIETSDLRAESAINLLQKRIGAKWSTYIKMLDNGRTRYLLLHLTNHNDGRDLIKNVLWNCCPEGGWFARKTDDPKQYFLFNPEPDLCPLKRWVVDKLSEKSYKWSELEDLIRSERWLKKHLWQIIKDLRKEGKITPIGKFTQTANPVISLT